MRVRPVAFLEPFLHILACTVRFVGEVHRYIDISISYPVSHIGKKVPRSHVLGGSDTKAFIKSIIIERSSKSSKAKRKGIKWMGLKR